MIDLGEGGTACIRYVDNIQSHGGLYNHMEDVLKLHQKYFGKKKVSCILIFFFAAH